MTTIVSVTTTPIEVPLRMPFATATRTATTVESLLVAVRDADGLVGYGEAPANWRVTGESTESATACVNGPLAAVVVGRSMDDLETLFQEVGSAVARNPGAKGAVDVALHDLAAQRSGVPLATRLGGSLRVPTDVTVSAGGSVADAVERASFGVLKLKVGRDPAADVAYVRSVRDAVGPSVALRLDANQGWDKETAVRHLTALAGVGLELVEQPLPSWDVAGMAWVRTRVDTPVMADESVWDEHDLVRVVEAGAADLVNVKLAKCGGLSHAVRLVELAHAAGLGTMMGSMMETHVGVGAAAALASRTTMTADLDAAWWLTHSPVLGGPTYDGGVLVLPDVPGLGIGGIA